MTRISKNKIAKFVKISVITLINYLLFKALNYQVYRAGRMIC